MTTKHGLVIARDEHTSLIEFPSDCSNCSGCSPGPTQTLRLQGQFDQSVVINLSLKNQIHALFNSLGLPILLGVLAAFIANLLPSDEWVGIIASICGFSLGMLLCRPLSSAALQIKTSN